MMQPDEVAEKVGARLVDGSALHGRRVEFASGGTRPASRLEVALWDLLTAGKEPSGEDQA